MTGPVGYLIKVVREGLFGKRKPEQRPGGRKGGREEATRISAKRKRRCRDPRGAEWQKNSERPSGWDTEVRAKLAPLGAEKHHQQGAPAGMGGQGSFSSPEPWQACWRSGNTGQELRDSGTGLHSLGG